MAILLDAIESGMNEGVREKRKRHTPTIESSLNTSIQDCYKKMMRTAWNMALTPSMPHQHFAVLIKCQRENGVRLVEGRESNKAGMLMQQFYSIQKHGQTRPQCFLYHRRQEALGTSLKHGFIISE